MIFVPFIPRSHKPVTYVERVQKRSEIVSVTCRVRTYVEFLHGYFMRETTETVNGMLVPRITVDELPAERYAFVTAVELTATEYNNNEQNLDEYILRKLIDDSNYTKTLDSIIKKYANGRGYEIKSVLPLEDPNSVEIKYSNHETRMFVPMEVK